MDLANLRSLFFKWLPGLLSILILISLAILFIQKILPSWQNYQALSDNISTQQANISTRTAAESDNQNQVLLQHLIDDTQGKLNTVGDTFLTQSEADQVLKRIYDYAYSRGVRVTSLQAQQPAPLVNATDAAPYTVSTFQLQVSGGAANLIDFISHFHEASLPAINIVSMNVTQVENQAQLAMGLQIYISPFASGRALNSIPAVLLDTTTPTPTQAPSLTAAPTITLTRITTTPVPPTAVPSSTATFTAPFTSTLTSTVVPTPSATQTLEPTGEAVVCPGAQSTLFKVGDIAVVHFSNQGALRLLSDPNGSVMSTRTQAYDKHRLEIIAGPVCANSSYYWYIRNLSQKNALGWVAEGKGEERWLCPDADPVCTP